MSKLRTPALVVSGVTALLAVLVETGCGFRTTADIPWSFGATFADMETALTNAGSDDGGSYNDVDGFSGLESLLGTESEEPPGFAIDALAGLDGILLFTLVLFLAPLVVNQRVHAQIQGFVTLIAAILFFCSALFLLLKALAMLLVMFFMLIALPFGTILYMILYADFDTTEASAILSTTFTLKVICAVCLVLAHEKFLKNLCAMSLLACCIVAGLLVGILHNFPPGFLVSITDAIAAIIVAIISIGWSVWLFIGAIISIVKVILGANKVLA